MEPEEIPLDTPVGELDDALLVETETGRTLVRRAATMGQSSLEVHLPDGRQRKLDNVPDGRTLRQAVASLSSARPLRAFRLAGSTIGSRTNVVRLLLAYLPMIVGVGVAGVGVTGEWLRLVRFLLIGVGITLAVIGYDGVKKSQRYRKWTIESGGDATRADALALPPPPDEVDVDDVKAEYGRLLTDIVYRIEYPALFDPHEPTSKAFTLALLQWDNNDGVIGADERRELAHRVRSTFEAARANAERIGMAHLPAEALDRAGTALKAARLATDRAATESERETALRRAVEILDQLALYYLPSGAEARKAITGHAPLQLPGRRSD